MDQKIRCAKPNCPRFFPPDPLEKTMSTPKDQDEQDYWDNQSRPINAGCNRIGTNGDGIRSNTLSM